MVLDISSHDKVQKEVGNDMLKMKNALVIQIYASPSWKDSNCEVERSVLFEDH